MIGNRKTEDSVYAPEGMDSRLTSHLYSSMSVKQHSNKFMKQISISLLYLTTILLFILFLPVACAVPYILPEGISGGDFKIILREGVCWEYSKVDMITGERIDTLKVLITGVFSNKRSSLTIRGSALLGKPMVILYNPTVKLSTMSHIGLVPDYGYVLNSEVGLLWIPKLNSKDAYIIVPCSGIPNPVYSNYIDAGIAVVSRDTLISTPLGNFSCIHVSQLNFGSYYRHEFWADDVGLIAWVDELDPGYRWVLTRYIN